ncbi:hypothetical protein OGAPHI_007311 [Ogataea philodendri]|uniref:Uncharacterized protein n=1 Tax=Ogataea philodendri TaxID=1378263 RepID=A0A9P8SZ72_9ASCO|nr:uncharacterized protein OGAPHI_007311 [Ogataea philodendri]KAH3660106.1 hypothetical protein OGAPHI_007311 [Ogataea philodendri]
MSSPPSSPNQQHELKPPIRRGHRHRRSAAISGDFDVQEFGLLPPVLGKPVPGSSSSSLAVSLSGSPVKSPHSQSLNDDALFTNRPKIPLNTTPSSVHSDKFSGGDESKTRYFITEDTTFESGSGLPRALIDLDDVFTGSRQPAKKSTRTMSAPELESFHIPKHSLLHSPTKNDVAIAEGITEEDIEDGDQLLSKVPSETSDLSYSNSAKNTPLMAGIIMNDNCSSNSLNSLSSSNSLNTGGVLQKNMANFNTTSISSLRGKVRYQLYFNSQQKLNTQATSTPSSSATADSDRFGRRPILMPPSSCSSPSSALRAASKSRSPVRNSKLTTPQQKGPFQFEPIVYEIPKSFHRDSDYSKSMSMSENSTSYESPSVDVSKPEPSPIQQHKGSHTRSSSLFSVLSSKFHHRRKSSVLSTANNASIIEKTTDEIFGLSDRGHANDSTLLFDDQTLTEEVIGEPGPMVEVVEPKQALSSIPNHAHVNKHSKSKSTSFVNFTSYESKKASSNSYSGASRFFGWMMKSRKTFLDLLDRLVCLRGLVVVLAESVNARDPADQVHQPRNQLWELKVGENEAQIKNQLVRVANQFQADSISTMRISLFNLTSRTIRFFMFRSTIIKYTFDRFCTTDSSDLNLVANREFLITFWNMVKLSNSETSDSRLSSNPDSNLLYLSIHFKVVRWSYVTSGPETE